MLGDLLRFLRLRLNPASAWYPAVQPHPHFCGRYPAGGGQARHACRHQGQGLHGQGVAGELAYVLATSRIEYAVHWRNNVACLLFLKICQGVRQCANFIPAFAREHTSACAHAHTHTRTHAHMHICTHVCAYTHSHTECFLTGMCTGIRANAQAYTYGVHILMCTGAQAYFQIFTCTDNALPSGKGSIALTSLC